jgi:hypothetical protein
MVGDPRIPGAMTDNTSARKRNSGLKARLLKLWEMNDESLG